MVGRSVFSDSLVDLATQIGAITCGLLLLYRIGRGESERERMARGGLKHSPIISESARVRKDNVSLPSFAFSLAKGGGEVVRHAEPRPNFQNPSFISINDQCREEPNR